MPIPSPTQNPRKLWFPWRLPGGTKKASEDELEIASTSAERWGWASGGVVAAGVLGEFALALIHPPYDSFRWFFCSLACDAAIAVGVAAEVGFAAVGSRIQSELRERWNERLRDTANKLAEAERELAEARKAVRWVKDEQFNRTFNVGRSWDE